MEENNGEFYSAWKVAKIGAISMIAVAFTIAAVAFISGDLSRTEPDFDTRSHSDGIDR